VSRARPAAVTLAFTIALASGARAEGGPPAGWEVAPTPTKKSVKPLDRCGTDETCLHRQTVLDAPLDTTPWFAAEIDLESLPIVRSLRAPEDAEALRAVPPVRAIDGAGRPFPWPDGAKIEARLLPPGQLGEVTWRDSTLPFFEKPSLRSMGYGATHTADDDAVRRGHLDGAISFVGIGAEGESLVYDFVDGRLEGTPDVLASRWDHAVAAALAGGLGHAFRSEGSGASLTVLLPEVLLDFQSRGATSLGGFTRDDRFSTNTAFTRYVLPVRRGASATVTFLVLDQQRRRWFEPKVKTRTPELTAFVLATSQTSAEAEPTVVLFARPRPLH